MDGWWVEDRGIAAGALPVEILSASPHHDRKWRGAWCWRDSQVVSLVGSQELTSRGSEKAVVRGSLWSRPTWDGRAGGAMEHCSWGRQKGHANHQPSRQGSEGRPGSAFAIGLFLFCSVVCEACLSRTLAVKEGRGCGSVRRLAWVLSDGVGAWVDRAGDAILVNG